MPARGEPSTNATFGDVSVLDRSMYYWASVIQTLIEQSMYVDTSQLPSFTPSDDSIFLHFKDTNFECQQQSMKSKYFTIDVYKCMHAMYDMHDPNTGAHDPNIGSSVEQNYACNSECENNVLH